MCELVLRMKETARTMLRGTAFEFVSKGEVEAPTPSLELRRNLFPMFKEILHNISRHSRATRVGIQIDITSHQFQLRVEDNGSGFEDKKTSGGNGLKNLRRRAADVAGSVDIRSMPGHGTTITVSMPIP